MKLRNLALLAGAALLAGSVLLTGCSKSSGGEDTGGPGELADEALVTYQAPDGSYSFQHPQSWTEETDSNGNVRFAGRDAFVGVVVRPDPGTDLTAFATQDAQAVATEFAGYKQISIKDSKEVKNAVILTFEWDAGKSAVTGKDVRAHVDRYYIPVSNGRVAIMTGSEPVSAFDRETVRDVALTVKVN